MHSPILGGFSVSRSTQLADNELINLYPEVVETKDAKAVGAFWMAPGLDLLATAGTGPIRGAHTFNGLCYIVSANSVYTIDTSYNVTLLGTIANLTGPVTMIDNGVVGQLLIMDSQAAYIVPGGQTLVSGTIFNGGQQYAVNDTIVLAMGPGSGKQTATAKIRVASVSASGAVQSFLVVQQGAFNPTPTSFVQKSTSGSGSNFSIFKPVFTGTVGVISVELPFTGGPNGQAAILDGFGLVWEAGTNKIWQSDNLDLSVWNPLNFAISQAEPDNGVSLVAHHDEIYALKTTSVEVWVDAGLNGFAFQPLTGVQIEIGCVAPFSVAVGGEVFFFLSQNDQGQGMVVEMRGYAPVPISTQAMVSEIATYTTISDAIGYCYQQNGHVFYVLTFPTANKTWVYDLTASTMVGYPLWHRRSEFLGGLYNRHWGNAFAFFNGGSSRTGVLGDYRNGNLYAFNMDTLTDNGAQRKWLRSWRALEKPRETPTTFRSLRVDMETGNAVQGSTANPLLMLRWSDDGGNKWSNPVYIPVGKIGEVAKSVKTNRLGSTRRHARGDRIFELSSTDQFKVALVGADIEIG